MISAYLCCMALNKHQVAAFKEEFQLAEIRAGRATGVKASTDPEPVAMCIAANLAISKADPKYGIRDGIHLFLKKT